MSSAQNEVKKLICEACEKRIFLFSRERSCWCFDLKIEASALLEIEKKYDDCLCGSCLLMAKKKSKFLSGKRIDPTPIDKIRRWRIWLTNLLWRITPRGFVKRVSFLPKKCSNRT
jgi:hypothetical protein